MKKKIWIMNHYATNMYFNEGGRHYWFAENLIKQGYEPTIFCANTRHNSNDVIELNGKLYSVANKNNIPFVFVKTPEYKGNGKSRIFNMVSFYRNIFPIAKKYAKKNGKPDVILASSVHPLTLVAGIKIGNKFGIPCICEVRDLWPETLVSYGAIKGNSKIAKILYWGEKWIYKNADKLIFTMQGGKDYIINQKWNIGNGDKIELEKVFHINNGIDINRFDFNSKNNMFVDKDLQDKTYFNVVYTGSIRKVNNVEYVLEIAKELQDTNIRFLLWGDGDYVDIIRNRILNEGIKNTLVKGKVDKKYIPSITKQADVNIIFGDNNALYNYGLSPNKLFDYFAAGKPILITFSSSYSLVSKYKTGIEMKFYDAKEAALHLCNLKEADQELYDYYSINARKAAKDHDYQVLTKSLIDIINM